jgi:2-oxoglutarate ferredoxin oxidoreductase subunit alpha
MATDITIRIGGKAGQGMQIISYTLGKMLARGGYHVFASQDVMSRVRGGHNFANVRVCDRPVFAQRERCDVLVALDERTVAEHCRELAEHGVVVQEQKLGGTGTPLGETSPSPYNVLPVPLEELATRYGADPRMINSVALGAVLSLTGYPIEPLLAVLKDEFSLKGSDIVSRNQACARAGYEFAQRTFKQTCPCRLPELSKPVSRLFMSGAEAVGLSAILSGIQFYAGYPMSPSTSIMEYLAGKGREHGIIVHQAEDEIAAFNLALGASFAGARAMTGSAGGGFSLMTEGLSLAGMTETPIVIALCSRPGPATGLATRQAQADLLFACHAGHGEFNRVIFAPGTAEQAFHATNQAFDITEKYQVPAILLLDQHLNDSYWTIGGNRLSPAVYRLPATGPTLAPYTYKRYALPASAGLLTAGPSDPSALPVSPLLRPGTPNQVRCDDSDEHTEEGHITESAEIRRAMVAKRLGKVQAISMELAGPECFPDAPANTVALCFGSTAGVVREAVDRLRQAGASIAMMHLNAILPFPREAVLARLAKTRRIITVEGNATAQLARLVTTQTRLKIADSVLKYDGRPFSVEEVEREMDRLG